MINLQLLHNPVLADSADGYSITLPYGHERVLLGLGLLAGYGADEALPATARRIEMGIRGA